MTRSLSLVLSYSIVLLSSARQTLAPIQRRRRQRITFLHTSRNPAHRNKFSATKGPLSRPCVHTPSTCRRDTSEITSLRYQFVSGTASTYPRVNAIIKSHLYHSVEFRFTPQHFNQTQQYVCIRHVNDNVRPHGSYVTSTSLNIAII
jgi:hypothetical protein